MPCCHIPEPENPAFPDSLIPDARLFALYVGGGGNDAFENPQPTRILTSALHLEMKLWQPTEFDWYPNDAQRNSWGVMSNRTTSPEHEHPRFLQRKQCQVFSNIDLPENSKNCCLQAFDSWLLSKLDELRNEGLANAGLEVWIGGPHNKPPELGTFGLAKKLINIFLKYEICWQVSGQWVNGGWVPYNAPAIQYLPGYLCALHAPLDRILLVALKQLELGKWLIRTSACQRCRHEAEAILGWPFSPMVKAGLPAHLLWFTIDAAKSCPEYMAPWMCLCTIQQRSYPSLRGLVQ